MAGYSKHDYHSLQPIQCTRAFLGKKHKMTLSLQNRTYIFFNTYRLLFLLCFFFTYSTNVAKLYILCSRS